MSVLMKPSGIKWIGDIPDDWNVKVLKRLLEQPLKYGANEAAVLEDKNFPRYIRITDFGNDGLLKINTFRSLEPDVAEPYLLAEGDILFARSGATVGKTFQFKNYEGKACFAGYLIKANPKHHMMTSDFLYYFTKSPAYESWKESIFTQATIQNIGADKYAYLPVCVPSIVSQNIITKFLDKSTSKIEDAIKTKQAQLKTLETLKKSIIHKAVTKGLDDSVTMKDSEIEWIGVIPIHWDIKRLFNICDFVRGNSAFGKNELLDKGTYVALQYGKTYKVEEINEQFKFYVNDEFYKSSQIVNYEDTIFVSTSETMEDLGHSVFYNRKDIGLIGGEQILLKPNQNILAGKYLFYSSKVFGKGLKKFATGIKVFRFDVYDLKTIYAPLPPLKEQQYIMDHLDKEVGKIDTLTSNIQKQINKLKEYKKSLIYEYVTGKKQVKE